MVEWDEVFDAYGSKVVSRTDKGKAAYVPTAEQRRAIGMAGIQPSNQRPAPEFNITILSDPLISTVGASYYNSERAGAERIPEARMGHGFISSWLEEGDEVVIGVRAGQLFAAKTQQVPTEDVVTQLSKRANPQTVITLAKQAVGQPSRRSTTRQDFDRNPFVVEAAKIRAKGRCEMPGCQRPLFSRDDNTNYLEVHHIVPLGEDGDDTLVNAAALCPSCHRELHFGVNRVGLRTLLLGHIRSLPF